MSIILRLGLLLCVVGFLQGNPTPRRKGYGPGEQEWGHIDVRRGAHMFYWLFYVQDPKVTSYYTKPLVIWLQGGPGGSSTGFGNFEEIGPLHLNGSARVHSWAKYVNLLFIDNPVGAGFSYVDDQSLLTRTNAQIGQDMISFLTTFYKTYPKFEKTPLYIFCESYGGKMAVEIAKQLLEAVKNQKIKANLKGVGLGDSWISPVDSVNTWAPFLFQTGMIDRAAQNRIAAGAKQVQNAVNSGQFAQATRLWGNLEMSIMKEAGNIDFYNILYKVKPMFSLRNNPEFADIPSLRFGGQKLQELMEGPVKRALGVPAKVVHDRQHQACFDALSGDFMKPVVNVVEQLLDTTDLQVIVFTGNLDLIVDTPGTVIWVDNMKWKGAAQWKTAKQVPMTVQGTIEGYVKNVGNLYLYTVLRAGHMVPTDNPVGALEVLRRTTFFDQVNADESS